MIQMTHTKYLSYWVETKCPTLLLHTSVVFELLKGPRVLPKYKQLNGLIIANSPKYYFSGIQLQTDMLW